MRYKTECRILSGSKAYNSKVSFFAQQIANANLLFKDNLPYHTAATDGKNIYFDPNYLESLNDDEKLFIIAHELMHIKFEHMYRMTDKNGQIVTPKLGTLQLMQSLTPIWSVTDLKSSKAMLTNQKR